MHYSKNKKSFKEKLIKEKTISHNLFQTTLSNNSFKIITCQK